MSAGGDTKERRAWPAILCLVVITVVLVGVPWAFKLASAPALGQPCGGGFDCEALDGRCVVGKKGSFCTVVCEQDQDCPDSAYCGVPPFDAWRLWFASSPMSEQVCVPGRRPAKSAVGDVAMPSEDPGAQFHPPHGPLEQEEGADASEGGASKRARAKD